MQHTHYGYNGSPYTGQGGDTWIGLNDVKTHNHYEWVDGTPCDYTMSPTVSPTPSPTSKHRQYFKVSSAKSWQDAETYCSNMYGTNLATIITDADFAEAVKMQHTHYGYNGSPYTGLGGDIWIGLNDLTTHNQYEWVDGSMCGNINYWATGQPSHSNEHCGAMYGDWSSDKTLFTDYSCDYQLGFLCNCVEQNDGTYYCPKEREIHKREYLCIYSHWAPGQPSHSDEHCGAMYGDWSQHKTRYTDYNCEYKLGFLCNCIQQLDGTYHCPDGKPTNA
eukprot:1911_1